MCRCEKPQWVNLDPGEKVMQTVARCEVCKSEYFGTANEAEAACKLWQKFFVELAKLGITRHGAQCQLWQRYKDQIQGGTLDLDNLTPQQVTQFRSDMKSIGVSCV